MTFSDKGEGVDQLSKEIALPSWTETQCRSLLMLLSDSLVGINSELLEEIEGFGKPDFECPSLEFLNRPVKWFVLPSVFILVLERVVQDSLVGLDQLGFFVCEWRVWSHVCLRRLPWSVFFLVAACLKLSDVSCQRRICIGGGNTK